MLEFQCRQPFEEVGSLIEIYRDGDLFVSVPDDLPDDEDRWEEIFSPEQCAMVPLLCMSIKEGTTHLYGTYLDYLGLNSRQRSMPRHEVTTRSSWRIVHPYLEHVVRKVCAAEPIVATKR
ncbi:MAG: hypothetical protein U0514_02570 [Candidatus Andersenbacteria bacterium]